MMCDYLNEHHVRAALAQGWMIWDTQNRGYHALQIQCVDDAARVSEELNMHVPQLDTDAQAVQVMKTSYELGEDHAIQAYHVIKQHSRSEFAFWRMHTWQLLV